MEEKILGLIYDYSSSNKMDNFIYDLLNILISYKNLGNYIESANVGPNVKAWPSLASYSINNKCVVCDTTNIEEGIKIFKRDMPRLNGLEKNILRNVIVTYIVAHEVYHAVGHKKVDLDKKDFETEILKICFRHIHAESKEAYKQKLLQRGYDDKKIADFFKEKSNIDKRNYEYAFDERVADTYALKMTRRVLDLIKPIIPHLYRYFGSSLYDAYLRGYTPNFKRVDDPFTKYLENMGYSEELKSLPFYSENKKEYLKNVSNCYSVIKRFLYGLPVSKSEYNSLVRKREANN